MESKSSSRLAGATLPRVRAISRAVKILRSFSSDRPRLALGDIVRATGLDAGTTRRILVTLRDEGLIHQDPANGLYSASIGLRELANAVPSSITLTSIVEARLLQLAEETQTTIYLSIARDDEALCTARKNGGQAIEVRWWAVNEVRPFNRGTGPRVLMAYLDEPERERVIADKLQLDTAAASALKNELEAIVSDGFIVKHDEIAAGISAIAVPLLNQEGKLLAAISSGGLTPRYIGAAQADILSKMEVAAKDMQKLLRGYDS